MATIRANSRGEILQFLRNEEEESAYAVEPAETSFTVIFDEQKNEVLINLLDTDWNSFSCPQGVLNRNGAPFAIKVPGQKFKDIESLGNIENILSPGSGNLTQAQIKTLFRIILRKFKKLNN